MSNIKTLAANMHSAFIDGENAVIGGGIFTPQELKDGALALKAHSYLLDALKAIIEEAGPDFGHTNGPGTINRMAYAARTAVAKLENK